MKYLSPILYTLLAMTVYIAIQAVGPALETKFWPVYDKFKVVRAEDTSNGLKIITSFNKQRDCDPQGYGWYLGEFGILKQVVTRAADVVQRRPMGRQIGTFTIKELTLKDLPFLYAEVYHHCHDLWTTRSVIYP